MTLEELAQKCLTKYFPPTKTAKLKNDITTFTQWENKSLYKAWERFRDLLRKCHYHDISIWLQIKTFYKGFDTTNHSMLDVIVCGEHISKTFEAAYKLLKELVSNNYK